ncbi:metallophosphoesterase family protein [Bacillus luteolus]|uniref:Phosphoesterase n=1 Tax=Litchfieldia luteola TaxID=682179 RepID=A0ABR9QIW3_9BACI|nr:metallophosphoesterase family protein [Cytobacillus luteolus]MBE4908435.1 metallophosphoesterase family protein [Cytobacillus luteolus]MBP1941281.1 putative phosphoesterase [Cytobacillus luteolus]
MKIIVLSDTHMPKRGKKLPDLLVKQLANADLIIHAGDWTDLEVLTQLEKYGTVVGVSGNVDTPEVSQLFGDKKVLQLNGFKIGIVHGHIGKKKTTQERALEAFNDPSLDVIIFGHSHIPYQEYHEGTLLFNPGSPTDKRFQKEYSFGILELNDKIHADICYYHDKT